jgi:hypothetical protein
LACAPLPASGLAGLALCQTAGIAGSVHADRVWWPQLSPAKKHPGELQALLCLTVRASDISEDDVVVLAFSVEA